MALILMLYGGSSKCLSCSGECGIPVLHCWILIIQYLSFIVSL
jgi:hypothetical protein